jgi:hypothetical protein
VQVAIVTLQYCRLSRSKLSDANAIDRSCGFLTKFALIPLKGTVRARSGAWSPALRNQ